MLAGSSVICLPGFEPGDALRRLDEYEATWFSASPTMHRVLQILVGLLPGWEMPRFSVPSDRKNTIPYGVAITFGSLISLAIFRA